ncbi:gliding motility-associated C-terminal domain-containing protein [Hyphobacterium sp. CCMP332]|nr:gliding motility-associated C-terminal domain-containing protein [Hyphobacterium sp. CCMP332]
MRKLLFSLFLLSIFDSYGQVNLNDSLIIHYPFNGNAIDISGNNLNGTNIGVVPTVDRFGNANSAMQFNGSNAYISVGDIIDIPTETAISITGWFKPETVIPSINRYAGVSFGKKTTGELALRYTSESLKNFNAVLADGSNISSSGNNTGASTTFNQYDQWVYISATFQNGQVRIYENGEFKNANSGNNGIGGSLQSIPINAVLRIGQAFNTNDAIRYYHGAMDDLRIYNRRLNDCEIKLLYDPNYDLSSFSESSLCLNESILLQKPGYNSYKWYSQDTLLSTSSTFIFNHEKQSPIVLKGTDKYGCLHLDTFKINIGGRESEFFYLGKCKEDSFLLIQPDTLTNVNWYKNGTLFASNTDSLILTDTVSTLIVLEGLDGLGCLIRDTFVISSLNPKSEIDDYEKLICHSTKDSRFYNIVGNGFSRFNWSITGGEIIENDGLSVVINWEDIDQASLKVVEISPNGCISDTLEFEFEKDITSISFDLITFSEDFASLEMKGSSDFNEELKNIHLLNSKFDTSSFFDTKSFEFLTDTALVKVEESFQFNLLDKCENSISSDSVKPILISLEIDDENNLIELSWENLSIWENNEISNEVYELNSNLDEDLIARIGYDNNISVLFSKKDFKRCFYIESRNTSFDLISRSNIKCIELEGELFIPNIITPNGDAYNDCLVIPNLDYFTSNKFIIYNRYGIEVYRSLNYKNEWCAENLPSGQYFYHLILNNYMLNYKGFIEVLK